MISSTILRTLLILIALLLDNICSGGNVEGWDEPIVAIPQQRRDRDIYVIGDLHGDIKCAKHWVQRIAVVDNVDNPQIWLQPNASLIFLGDYIDKGPFSYQTLSLVKKLTESFPDHVTALMGNHEMELLKDRHAGRKVKYFHQISHVIHPSEYANHNMSNNNRLWDESDDLVVDLLLNATLNVYGLKKNAPPVHFTPERLPDAVAKNPHRKCVVDYVEDQSKKQLVRERLAEYQQAYLAAFMSNTSMGSWMERTLKVAHVENGILFTHGGMETKIATQLSTNYASIDAFHEEISKHISDDKFFPFIINTPTGQLVENMLYHRGNHEEGACDELGRNLELWGGVHSLAVGHTPLPKIRHNCNGQFWALDSLLGRWIRTSQGFHCAPNEVRSRGNFTCPRLQQKCRGQTVKILSDGNVEVMEA